MLGSVRRAAVVVLVLAGVVAGGWVALRATAPRPVPAEGWRLAAPLPLARGESAGAVSGGRLVVAGGLHGLGRTSARADAYDPATGAWTRLPDLPAPRHHLAAGGTAEGAVWAVGGAASARDWTPRTEVWVLDAGAQAWRPGPTLPEGRVGHRLVAVGGRLHVVGGDGPSTTTFVLDPADEAAGWQAAAPLPVGRDHLGAVAVGDDLWVLGGRNAAGLTDRVDVYDTAAGVWRAGPTLPVPTSAAAVGVVGGRVVVVGGEDPTTLGGGVIRGGWMLAADGSGWEPLPDPPLAVHGAADGVVGDRLVIAGGAGRQGALSVTSWTAAVQVLDRGR
jgi:hypothetical protein